MRCVPAGALRLRLVADPTKVLLARGAPHVRCLNPLHQGHLMIRACENMVRKFSDFFFRLRGLLDNFAKVAEVEER